MQISAKDLAQLLKGVVEGNPDVLVSKPSKIEEGVPGTISFLANPKYEPYAYTTNASILLVKKEFQPSQEIAATLIRVDDVYACVAFLLEKFGAQQKTAASISDQAAIHASVTIGKAVSIGTFTVVEEGASIGDNSYIYPQVFVGKNVKIGKNVTLYPGVRIQYECEIGDNCILHSNVVIGADGFGFAPQEDGTYKKVAQIGNVILEENVEIGANTTIDRATMGATIIRAGAKIDNLVMVAHNVEINKNTVIAAQAGIAGSTKIGKNCIIGGQVGIVGHIKLADHTKIQAQSGVTKSTKEGAAIYGSPALPYKNYLLAYSVFKNLPTLEKRVRAIEKKIKD